ncbi:MAG: hypothetical protein ACRDOK_31045 [Streptosporangiaceae bacterium]
MIFAHIEDSLNRALELVGRCDEVYRLGGQQVRRLSNQFFFEKLLIARMSKKARKSSARCCRSPGQPFCLRSSCAPWQKAQKPPDKIILSEVRK